MMNCSAFLVLLMLAGATLGEVQKRIIGGRPCNNNEARHHVVLYSKVSQDEYNVCGGSLISSQWVLTAAHCTNGTKKEDIRAILNRHPDSDKAEPANIIETIQYNNTDGHHDIMLLKLKESFSVLEKAKLPRDDDCNTPLTKGDPVHINGLFKAPIDPSTLEKGESVMHDNKGTLHCGDLKITDCGDMSVYRNDRDLHDYSYSWLLCAQDPNGKVDSCGGNSGGSMLKGDVLYGVITGSSKFKCGHPVIFMDVCKYRAWIREKTNV